MSSIKSYAVLRSVTSIRFTTVQGAWVRRANHMGAVGQEHSMPSRERTRSTPVAENVDVAGGFTRQATTVMSHDFVKARIFPLVPTSDVGRDVQVTILQNTGTGRLTLRYDLGRGKALIGKMFTDELGNRSRHASTALWDSGFNQASRYQVPAVVGYFPDCNLLLMHEVPGVPIAAALDESSALDLVSEVREAARWLAKLHRSPVRFGKAETDWESLKLFRLATRFIKAAAVQPQSLDMMRDVFRLVSDRVNRLDPNRPLLPSHSRYHHDHVFVGSAATVVIDLDRCSLSDPGKDVAEFISVLRSSMFKRGADMARAEMATNCFLSECFAQVPEAEATVGCYWAVAVMHDLLSGLKKGRSKGKRTWQEVQEFYLGEIHRALGMA